MISFYLVIAFFPLWVHSLTKGFFAFLFPAFPVMCFGEIWQKVQFNIRIELIWIVINVQTNIPESASKLMLMSCFLLKQAWMILFFQVRRCQDRCSVLCIQGPFIKRLKLGCVSTVCLGYFVNRTMLSRSSQLFRSNKWSAVSSVVSTHKGKRTHLLASSKMGFPVSVVVFLLRPAFTHESLLLPILKLKVVGRANWIDEF